MIMSSRNLIKCPAAFFMMAVVCLLITTWSDTADARGGRGAGGGFSRSSPAIGGSFSGGDAMQSRVVGSAGDVGQPRTVRNAGDVGQPRTVRNAGDIGQPRAANSGVGVQSVEGVQSAGGAGQARSAGDAKPVTAEQMAAYRQQFAAQNPDRDNWDQVDPDYGVTAPVAPAAVVGAVAATAVARNRADDYVDYVNAVADPEYLTEDSCSIKAIAAVNDVTYYRCSDAWYKRGYQSGSVVYIPTDAPPGY